MDSALADRVRLYLRVTFLMNLAFCAATVLGSLLEPDVSREATENGFYWVVFGVAAASGAAWGLISWLRPGFIASIVISGVSTVVLALVYSFVSASFGVDEPMVRSLFAVTIVGVILMLRATLVPSPVPATILVGVCCMAAPMYYARPALTGALGPLIWQGTLAVIIVAVTALTSFTIYGMERRIFSATQLGRYSVKQRIGQGGMGDVYLAEHALLKRPTALKLLRDASTPEARARFRNEVQVASSLTHPNTVEIYDYGRTPEGVFYFAMEYMEGATIEQIVSQTGPIPPRRAIHLLLQAARSLGEAHGRGLVHRDVKPSNLMLCERGGRFDTLKVTDFGLVRDVADISDDTALAGTPLYIAPEMILDSDGAIPESDVYSLAATAVFLLTGSPPFHEVDVVGVLSAHLATPPPRVECGNPALTELLIRCLSKDPEDRPSSADQMADALEACQRNPGWSPVDAETWWAMHGSTLTNPVEETRTFSQSSRGRSLARAASRA
jgi:serine/threonine-protein kinase